MTSEKKCFFSITFVTYVTFLENTNWINLTYT